MTATRLARRLDGAMLGGIASGLADRYDFDVTVVRVAAVLLAFATGGLVVVGYLLLWLLLPAAPATPATPLEGAATEQASDDGKTSPRRDLNEVVEAARIVAENLARAAREATDAAQAAAKELAELASRAARTTTAAIDLEPPPEPATEATATIEPDEDAPTVEEQAVGDSEESAESTESSAESYAWGDDEQDDAPKEAEAEAPEAKDEPDDEAKTE